MAQQPQLPHSLDPLRVALIVTLGSAGAFAALYFLRAPFRDGPVVIAIVLATTLLPVWCSALAWAGNGNNGLQRATSTALGFIAGLSAILIGVVVPSIASLVLAASCIAVAGVAWARRGALSSALRRFDAWALACCVLLVAIMLSIATPSRYFGPEAMDFGLAHTDTLYHAAIAQMLARHAIPSIGADGLIATPYHFLSHAIAAGLANLSSADVPRVYVYWGALGVYGQLAWAMYAATAQMHDDAAGNKPLCPVLLVAWASVCMFLLPTLNSESFVVALSYARKLVTA